MPELGGQMPEESGQIALVTGGSRGIGRAVATRLANDGFDVAICYRSDESAAEQVAKEIRAAGRRVLTRRVDVADRVGVRAFVADVESVLGPVTAVVTSAGITRDQPLALMQDDEWDSVLRTNLDGTYNLLRSVVRSMIRRREGTVVTLSSVAGVVGNAGQTNYSASKAGIIGLTQALAKEFGRYGIRANAVAPGFIDSPDGRRGPRVGRQGRHGPHPAGPLRHPRRGRLPRLLPGLAAGRGTSPVRWCGSTAAWRCDRAGELVPPLSGERSRRVCAWCASRTPGETPGSSTAGRPGCPPTSNSLAVRYPGRQGGWTSRASRRWRNWPAGSPRRSPPNATCRWSSSATAWARRWPTRSRYAWKAPPADGPGPALLLLSGRAAPHVTRPTALHRAADDVLVAGVTRLGTLGGDAYAVPELRELLLPVLRADYRLIETYDRKRPPVLRAPMVAYLGDRDPGVTRPGVEGLVGADRRRLRRAFLPRRPLLPRAPGGGADRRTSRSGWPVSRWPGRREPAPPYTPHRHDSDSDSERRGDMASTAAWAPTEIKADGAAAPRSCCGGWTPWKGV